MEQSRSITYCISLQDAECVCNISRSSDTRAEEWTVEYYRPANSTAPEGYAGDIAAISRLLLAELGLRSGRAACTRGIIKVEIPY